MLNHILTGLFVFLIFNDAMSAAKLILRSQGMGPGAHELQNLLWQPSGLTEWVTGLTGQREVGWEYRRSPQTVGMVHKKRPGEGRNEQLLKEG